MDKPEVHPLPVLVRRVAFETLASFDERLRVVNGVPATVWVAGLNRLSGVQRKFDPTGHLEVLEALAGLPAGQLRPAPGHPLHEDGDFCAQCLTGLSARFGCRRCTKGEVAELHPHDGPRVCRKHGLWIGPGIPAAEQFEVGAAAVRADRLYRRLRRAGVVDAHRLGELLDCVKSWNDAQMACRLNPAETFRIAVAIARDVLHPARLPAFQSRTEAAAIRYERLSRQLSEYALRNDVTVLVDGIWMLLRTMRHDSTASTHSFLSEVGAPNVDDRKELALLRTSLYPRQTYLHVMQILPSSTSTTRYNLEKKMHARHEYICPLGHRFISSAGVLLRSAEHGGCPFCARRRALAGFNSLADTHPDVAAEWHPTLNGDVEPTDVLAGSNTPAEWLCSDGHNYSAKPNSRTGKGSGCGFCAGRYIDLAARALSVTHPEVAEHWHPTKNGVLMPAGIPAESTVAAWWTCDEGHGFEMRVRSYVRSKKCSVCTRGNERNWRKGHAGPVPHGSRSLAATHPQLAEEWHDIRNGDLRPADVTAGSGRKVWWTCVLGHSYDAVIHNRAKGTGCRYCAQHIVADERTLRTVRPDLAAELHPTANGERDADNTSWNSTRSLTWVCRAGHTWKTSPRNRARGLTCRVCAGTTLVFGVTDLATTHPQLPAEWHPELNEGTTPVDVTARSTMHRWWQHSCGHVWRARLDLRARSGSGCPECYRLRRGH